MTDARPRRADTEGAEPAPQPPGGPVDEGGALAPRLRHRLRAPVARVRGRAERTVTGRALRRFFDDRMTERAAGLAFYALFSLIPILLIVSAFFSLVVGNGAADDVAQAAHDAGASDELAAVLHSMIETALRTAPEGASTAGLVSLGILVYGASKAFTDAGRALDEIAHRGRYPRSLVRRAADLGWTVLLIVLGLLAIILIFVTGQLVEGALAEIGIHDTGGVWNLVRWPAAIVVVLAMVAVVNWAAPASGRGRFRPFTPGSLVTVGLGLVASAGYAIYLANFAHYNATYGAFAAAVILMIWVWYLCLAFLYGAEVDAVLAERSPGAGEDRSPGGLAPSS